MSVVECGECGFVYVTDCPPGRRAHRRYHDEHMNGIRWPPSDKEIVVFDDGAFRIVLVEPGSPKFLRVRARKTGRRGNRETHYDFGVYSEFEPGVDALIGIIDDRAISICVLQRMANVWRWSWDEYDNRVSPREDAGAAGTPGCSFIWVLPAHRGGDIATKMADAAVRRSGLSPDLFPWLSPFTELGEGFLRRYCPGPFTIGRP